jgi:hypothetical protein
MAEYVGGLQTAKRRLASVVFFWKGSSLLLRSACALQKHTGCAPTHRGSENGHAAAASRPSRRHQSRTSLTQQSQRTGHRCRRGAAECAQKIPPCAPCARTRGRSRRERQPKPPLLSRQTGGGDVLTAERPGLFDIVVLFPLVSLPVAVAPPRPPPPPLPHVHQAPSPAAVDCWPFDLDDDSASVVVSKRLSAVW